MKKTTLLMTIALGTILFSCGTDNGQKKSETQKQPDDKAIAKKDSIKKVNELANLEEMRQDSIDAIQIKKYAIKKISGKHKYGGVTKIEYQSLAQLLDDTKKKSEKEMWTKEKLQSTLTMYKSLYKGGQIVLYIERTTIGSANTEMFSAIIKDKNETEIYRFELDEDIPEYSSDNWWNYGYISIEKKIKAPFFVYIADRLEDAPFKFEVTAVRK